MKVLKILWVFVCCILDTPIEFATFAGFIPAAWYDNDRTLCILRIVSLVIVVTIFTFACVAFNNQQWSMP